jgi:hypothetical protein
MSVQGSAVRSMEERSRPGSGFSGGRGAGAAAGAGADGAGVCWASEEGARAKHAKARVAIRDRRRVVFFETMLRGVSLMLGSPCGDGTGCGKDWSARLAKEDYKFRW